VSDAEAPTWRYLVAGLLFAGMAAYMLVNGEIAVDKRHTMFITRAGNPLLYWSSIVVCGSLGILSLRKVWRRLFS
jgi:hypothetical protein